MQGKIDKVIHTHGFGFLRSEDGQEVLFHRVDVLELDFHALKEGQSVEFDLPARSRDKILQAVVVRPSRA
jgi:cold shock CspA family protein